MTNILQDINSVDGDSQSNDREIFTVNLPYKRGLSKEIAGEIRKMSQAGDGEGGRNVEISTVIRRQSNLSDSSCVSATHRRVYPYRDVRLA